MDFVAVAAVTAGLWVDALVDTFLAMSSRQGFDLFILTVRHTGPANIIYPPGMTSIPQATGPIADAQLYQPVVDSLVARLPQNSNWQVNNHTHNSAVIAEWVSSWTVRSVHHNYRFQLEVRNTGTVQLAFVTS